MPKIDWRKLKKATGVGQRTLQRFWRDGAPRPRPREKPELYAKRLTPWRNQNPREKPGPKGIPGDGSAATAPAKSETLRVLQEEILQLKKDQLALELQRQREAFVSRADHERAVRVLISAVVARLAGQGERLRTRLARREEEDVQREIDADNDETRKELASGEWRSELNEAAVDRAGS